MREFRIKVNNEKTYVVKANDYNQAVKTLHSKLRDFDLTNFLALKRSLELRIGEEIDFDKLEEYVNKLPKDKNGKKNVDVKEVIKCCVKAKDNLVSDSISKYNGEDAIKTNGFVKIKEDGDWTSYKYNGSDFDDAVFKIHQYNPSLIAFISNGNRTITVRNKYLNDTDDTAQGEIEVLKSFGFDYKDGRWVKESNNNTIIAQPDYHYVSVIGLGDTEKHCKKYQYQSAGMLKKIIASNIKDSSINDIDGRLLPQSAKELKEELGLAKRVMGSHKSKGIREYKPRQNQLNNRDVAEINEAINDAIKYLDQGYGKDSYWRLEADLKRIQETMPADTSSEEYKVLQKVLKKGTKALEAIKSYTLKNDSSIEDSDSYQVWTINEKGVYHKEAEVSDPQSAKAIASQLKKQGRWAQISKNSKTNIVSDSNILSGYKFRIINNGTKWYYETTFPDGHITLTGPYLSKQETEQYFHKHRPTEKLTDANRYNKGQKIQTSAGIHEIIGYDPVRADVHTNRIEYSYRLKTPNGTYTNIPDWQLEELVKLGRYKLIDSDNNKKQQLKAELDKLDKEWDRLDNLGRPTEHITAEMEAIREELKKLEDCSTVMTKDAYPVKVEKIIRKEKSALGITYYLFQTKSNSGATIYYEVTDKTYHGEPTYSGGGVISFSLQSANDSLDSHLLSDKLKAKYGEKEGTKRYLRGENDSAIKDAWSGVRSNGVIFHYSDGKYTITHKNGKVETIPGNRFNTTEELFKYIDNIKDSANNIKNRKSYTIKVGDKQYKIFAESEEEAINKYIKSKKQ